MKNLFIDSNIWLSLYNFTNNDLEQFKKLKSYIDDSINLIVTEQVFDELTRNRENKINSAMKEFNLKAPKFPAFTKGYDTYESFKIELEELCKKYDSWRNDIYIDIEERRLPADKTIRGIIPKDKVINCDSVIDKANKRMLRGNPPGKNNSIGDAINWEMLLKIVPDNEDLYIISEDKDYRSCIFESRICPFLEKKWKEKKHGKINLYTSLPKFLREHLKDIKLVDQIEKEEYIYKLKQSCSFAQTHETISKLRDKKDWTPAQIDEICSCICNNSQVQLIKDDNDIRDFYISILKDIQDEEYGEYTKVVVNMLKPY